MLLVFIKSGSSVTLELLFVTRNYVMARNCVIDGLTDLVV